ncbi:MAG: CARDB domain-containing protein, partial [Armatimonadota bacterium]|nr:CARDB domain-containing protein [Armatimonadota bacterium]
MTQLTFSPAAGVSMNQQVTFEMTVRNGSLVPVPSEARVTAYLLVSGVPAREGKKVLPPMAPGEEQKLTFTWIANEVARPRAVAIVDADEVIPESNESNNTLAFDLPFDVARSDDFAVALTPADQPCPAGQATAYGGRLSSFSTVATVFDLTVDGLPAGWAALSAKDVYVLAGQSRDFRVTVTPPPGTAPGSYPFQVTARRRGAGDTRNADAAATVTESTAISELLPIDGQTFPSTSVVCTWRTPVSASSEVYVRREGEVAESRFEGLAGTFHQVILNGLSVGDRYLFRVRSVAGGSASESTPRAFTIAGGVSFTEKQYTARIARDYSQVVQIPIVNLGSQAASVRAAVRNAYDPEIVAGFAGPGSVDEVLTLAPGETANLNLVIHAPTAARPEFELPVEVRSGTDAAPIVDGATVQVTVPVKAELEVQELGTDPVTLIKTMRLVNKSDVPVADVRLELDESLKGKVAIRPEANLLRVPAKGSVRFELVPIFELAAHRDPAFARSLASARVLRVDTAEARQCRSRQLSGSVSATSAAGSAAAGVKYEMPQGMDIYAVMMENRLVLITVGLDVCTNVRRFSVDVPVPPLKSKDPFVRANLQARNPHGWPVQAHTTSFRLNGYPIGSIDNQVPRGSYTFRVPPSVLNLSDTQSSYQRIELESFVYNEAHYWRAGTLQLGVYADSMVVYVPARSADEALRVAQNQPYFQAHNDPEFDTYHEEIKDAIRTKSQKQRDA